jgi:hypothetical protein
MPWAMPLWRVLVRLLPLATKEHNNNDNNDDKALIATAMAMVMMSLLPQMATMSMTTTMDIGNWTMTMGRQQCDGNGRTATCRMVASAAPPIKGNNQLMWTVWRGGDKREGRFGGNEPQKTVKLELIEWRSHHLHYTYSKSSFCPSQRRKSTGTYSACILGARLPYLHHGEQVY